MTDDPCVAMALDGRLRTVRPGDQVQIIMPPSGVCEQLRVADQMRTVRILEHGVQVLNEDGTDYAAPITHSQAGVITRPSGMYVRPLPDTLLCVRGHGVRLSPWMVSRSACEKWVLSQGGYRIEPGRPADEHTTETTDP